MKKKLLIMSALLLGLALQTPVRSAPTELNSQDNVIYVEPITVASGSEVVLSIKMKNTNEVAGYQFNLQLPEGMTFATDPDGIPLAELSTERTTARRTNYFDSAIQDDGTLRVLCGTSIKNNETGALYAFSGNEGEVARITINVPASYLAGDYPIIVKNAIISDPEAVKAKLLEIVESTITVESSTPVQNFEITTNSTNLLTGMSQTLVASSQYANITWTSSNPAVATVSADGVVKAVSSGTTIITCSSNGITSAPFTVNVTSVGDVNHDGSITIADVTALVNIILGK